MARKHVILGLATSLLDQAVSSGTNLLMVIVIARQLNAEAFGAFSIAYSALVLVLAVTRTYLGIPIARTASSTPTERLSVYGGSLFVALASAPATLAIIGYALPFVLLNVGAGDHFLLCALVAFATVFVQVQDLSRYAAIAADRPSVALVSDGIWFVAVALLLATTTLGTALSDATYLVLWTLAIALGAAVGTAAMRPRPSLTAGRRLIEPHRGAREAATAVALLSTGTTLVLALIVSAAFSPADAGSLRGAGTLLGPTNLLLATLDLFVLGRIVRTARRARIRLEMLLTSGLVAIHVVWSLALLVLPASAGFAVLGASWPGARHVLPWFVAEYALGIVVAVAALELKVLDRGKAMLLSKCLASALVLGGTVLVAQLGAPFLAVPTIMVGSTLTAAIIVCVAAYRRPPSEAAKVAA